MYIDQCFSHFFIEFIKTEKKKRDKQIKGIFTRKKVVSGLEMQFQKSKLLIFHLKTNKKKVLKMIMKVSPLKSYAWTLRFHFTSWKSNRKRWVCHYANVFKGYLTIFQISFNIFFEHFFLVFFFCSCLLSWEIYFLRKYFVDLNSDFIIIKSFY